MAQSFYKDPDAVLDYEFDWAQWLKGDTIASHSVAVPASPSGSGGLKLESSSNTATAVTVWLSGGVAGVSYPATCHIVTAAGRKDDRTFTVIVRSR